MRKNTWYDSQECDEAMAYYVAGHSQTETAEKYGVSVPVIEYARKKRGLSNGRSFQEAGRIAANNTTSKRKAEAERCVASRLDDLGFDYLGGWKDKNSKLKIRCKKCGYVFERIHLVARTGKCECPECRRKLTEIRMKEKQRARQEEIKKQKKKREAERKMKNPNGFSLYQRKREEKLAEVYICKECGKEYTPREYVEDAGLKTFSNCGFCSVSCRKRSARKKQKDIKTIRHRVKKYGCVFDSSVTLKKLIERDGLRCHICGGMCDPNDHGWTEHFGPTSPTIDHIYPLSKGGSHTWDNVQVAHALCNSKKRDLIEEEYAYDAS